MLWIILDNLVLLYETWVLFFLAGHFFTGSRKGARYKLIYAVSVLLCHRIIAIRLTGHLALTALCAGIADYVLFGLLWPGQWRKRLFTLFFYYALMITLDLMLIFALPVQPDCPYLELYQLLCIIVSRTLLFFVLLAAIRLGGRAAPPANRFLLIALLPALLSGALLFSVRGYEVYDVMFGPQMSLTVAVILLVVLVLLFAYTQLMRNEEDLLEQLKARELLQKERDRYYDAILENYLLIRSTRHDLHHYTGTISALIQSGRYEQALAICKTAGQQLGNTLIRTGNETIDAVLYTQQALFRQAGATLLIEGSLPPGLEYDSADICVILSNALENALEAVYQLPVHERLVSSRFLYNGWLLMIVENKIAGTPITHQGRFCSGKPGPEHGIGLDSITAACKRQNGYLEVTVRDGRFILSATLQPKIPK